MSWCLFRRNVGGTPGGALCRTFRAVERAVLELPLSKNEVSTAERTLDHLAQTSQAFSLAFLLLKSDIFRGKYFEKRCSDIVRQDREIRATSFASLCRCAGVQEC